MLQQAFRDFLMLLVTIEPIGALALFVSLTAHLSAAERRRTAVRAVLYAAVVMVTFLIAGELLLVGLGIRLVSFQMAGGAVLFLLALQMVFGTGLAAPSSEPEPGHDIAIFPIALPAIAGPGAIMAIVLLTDNHRHSLPEQALTFGVLLVVLAITFVMLLLSTPILGFLGRTGASLLVRVMGLLLAALATEQILQVLEVVLKAVRAG